MRQDLKTIIIVAFIKILPSQYWVNRASRTLLEHLSGEHTSGQIEEANQATTSG